MSLEPAIAMLIGLLVLGQKPGPAPAVGIAFVVVAGIGATRADARLRRRRRPALPGPPAFAQEASSGPRS